MPERTLVESALTAAELPFRVLYIFGPGGIGKTSLLWAYAELCSRHEIPARYVDARSIEPTPDAFLEAVQSATESPDEQGVLDAAGGSDRLQVLMIDTYERLAPIDHWIRETFLTRLPENVLLVVATRAPPTSHWVVRSEGQPQVRTLPLRNLEPAESQAYLELRLVPPEQQQVVLRFTHGHPLALSLIADVFDQRPNFHFDPEEIPDVIKVLLDHLVQKAPGPAHRSALEACALVRVTTESLLADMLSLPDVHELFEWLRSLSFIEVRRGGLFPHDLVREILSAELRWRHPDWYAELRRRARSHYVAELDQPVGALQQRALMDYIYLHRDNPMVQPFFEWQASGSALPNAMRDDDVPALLALIQEHEGEVSAGVAAHWFVTQPHRVLVFRDPDDSVAGVLLMVALHLATAEDVRVDPGARATWEYLEQRAPIRPGESATLFRFWMARDTYQSVSPIQTLIFVTMVHHYLTTPGLAFTFLPTADPEFWAPVLRYANLTRIPDADFVVDSRRHGVYGHDWRAVPPMAWLELLAERETGLTPEVPNVAPAPRLLVLSQTEFVRAIRSALRDLASPYKLYTNPLLRSRLVGEHTAPNSTDRDRADTLHRLLVEAIEALNASPREAKYYRALYHTYVSPAPTQERAAELLDLPFSTFRRHLTTGIERVTDVLWRREVGEVRK